MSPSRSCVYVSHAKHAETDGDLACFLACVGGISVGATIFFDLKAIDTTRRYLETWARAIVSRGFVPGLHGPIEALRSLVGAGIELEQWELQLDDRESRGAQERDLVTGFAARCTQRADIGILVAVETGGRASIERDLYLESSSKFVRPAISGRHFASILGLLVGATDSERAYLELYPSRDSRTPHWTISHGCSSEEEAEIQAVTSRGIVAATLTLGGLRSRSVWH